MKACRTTLSRSLVAAATPVSLALALLFGAQPLAATPAPDPTPAAEVAADQPDQPDPTGAFIVVAERGTSAEEIKARAVASTGASAQLIYFAKNSAAITKASAAKLDKIAKLAKGTSVDVTGFTSSGQPAVSQTLASKRALAIARYLKKLNVNSNTGTRKGNSTTQAKSALVRINMAGQISAQSDSVDSLIVRYTSGKKPSATKPLLGTDKLTSLGKNDLTLGAYLGFGMYRIDLAKPISQQLADKVCVELTKSTSVDFAEPNGRVSTQLSTQ